MMAKGNETYVSTFCNMIPPNHHYTMNRSLKIPRGLGGFKLSGSDQFTVSSAIFSDWLGNDGASSQ